MDAFSDAWSQHHLAGVVLAGSVLSIVGSLYMIVGFFILPELRGFRHQLILGLAVSDLFLALNFFIPSFSMLIGQKVSSPANSNFCSANGFLTQFFFAQIDVWQVVIALVTLIMMSGPSTPLKWAREHVWALWLFPWLVSLIAAFFGFGIWDYADVGGFCWLGSIRVRLFFNFLPRWIIIFCTLLVYIHVYQIILRARRATKMQKTYRPTNAQRRIMSGSAGAIESTSQTYSEKDTKKSTTEVSSLYSSRAESSAGCSSFSRDPALACQLQTAAEKAKEEADQKRHVRKIALQMISYPLAYAVLWSIPTVIMVVEVVKGRDAVNIHVEGLSKMMLVFNGFVDAHIYGFNERTAMFWWRWLGPLFTRADRSRDGEADGVMHEVVSNLEVPAPTFKNPHYWQKGREANMV
ncbi:hypothetical protein H072_2752 [Dactylellina haptotyla CBS 200.50]|uniref:G-protein coupled receptors family 2 profile 2 domain-containing protein n=1 Tax=Dactylellina haptotyla (strain CBS 200.50) TaxID=1284197 RepID=S8AQE2_DACHA|nr:hypothetical protein H072_2752 [Dactylellina haptotyla CBS 200.50]